MMPPLSWSIWSSQVGEEKTSFHFPFCLMLPSFLFLWPLSSGCQNGCCWLLMSVTGWSPWIGTYSSAAYSLRRRCSEPRLQLGAMELGTGQWTAGRSWMLYLGTSRTSWWGHWHTSYILSFFLSCSVTVFITSSREIQHGNFPTMEKAFLLFSKKLSQL